MSEEIPADWAIERAIGLYPPSSVPFGRLATVKHRPDFHGALIAFARYIEQHEQPPVDELYEALKAVVELGRYDTREQTELLRRELAERGLVITAATQDPRHG